MTKQQFIKWIDMLLQYGIACLAVLLTIAWIKLMWELVKIIWNLIKFGS